MNDDKNNPADKIVGSSDVLAPNIIYLNGLSDDCCICGSEVVSHPLGPSYGIAMYEGIPVPDDWTGEWGGFAACKKCFDKHAAGEIETW